MLVCDFFRRGRCVFGDRCKFEHTVCEGDERLTRSSQALDLNIIPHDSTAVRRETHIFDPDGEVNIILQCPEYHFAPWNDHKEPPAEEPPTEGPPAEEPPVEEPVIFKEQLEEEHVKTQVFRVQASAKHLILASPVFQKALTESWKEGFHLLKKGAVEITISGWDLDAFLILMNIFHCRPQNLPREISLELLAKVAILADYYQCQTLVQYFAERWIKSLRVNLPTTYSRDSMLWVWVSWVFRQSYEFEKCTLLAISQSSNRITNLGLPIPEQVIDKMNMRRYDAITLILSSLAKLRDAFLDGSRGCTFECSSLMFGALTKQMHSNGLLYPQPEAPFIGLNYKGLVETARAIKSPKWPSHYRACESSSFSSLIVIQESTVKGLDSSFFATTFSYTSKLCSLKDCWEWPATFGG